MQENLGNIRRALEGASAGGAIVDLGCADGSRTVEFAAQARAGSIHGVELTPAHARAARARGVDVKVLPDPGNVDPFVPIIHLAPKGVVNAVALDILLKAKMEVRQYRVGADFTTAHMKLAVIDGDTLFAGSTNWTTGGFTTVAETNLEVHGGRAPGQAEAQFQKDWTTRGDVARPPSLIALQLCKLYQSQEGLPETASL